MSLLETHLIRYIDIDEAPILKSDPAFAEIVLTIKSVPENWKGNCFAVATLIAESGLIQNATAVYGHWLGKAGSYFSHKGLAGFIQHGWVLLEDGRILDPTRWVFEDVEPYIFIGRPPDENNPVCKHCGHVEDEHGVLTPCSAYDEANDTYCDCEDFSPLLWPYDEGGNQLREATAASRPLPEIPKVGERKPIFSKTSSTTLRFLATLFGDPDLPKKGTSSAQAFYLANLPYKILGEHVHEIYDALKAHELDAFVPIDNMMKSQRERPSASKR
jgi:hypothetical protein